MTNNSMENNEAPKKKPGNPNWEKGVSANPNGRPKGSLNKATGKVREAYQMLTEANLENMTNWLQTIAEDNPKEAFELMLKMSEYVLPKLARTEVTGKDGQDLFQDVKFEFGPGVGDRPYIEIEDIDAEDV